jgi:hypothetical protein
MSDDIYAITIAAILKNAGTPREQFFCLRQCVFCFVTQLLVAIFFGLEYLDFDKFRTRDWDPFNCCTRVICSVMLQKTLNADYDKCTKLMAYLISMKVTVQN